MIAENSDLTKNMSDFRDQKQSFQDVLDLYMFITYPHDCLKYLNFWKE